MGLQIPGELAALLNELGYTWPDTDEEKLFQLGQDWIGFASTVQGVADEARAAAATVWASSRGADIEAFRAEWSGRDSALAVLDRGVAGAQAIGGALIVCAALVLALKINVIVQLTILAIQIIQAIATAAPTFGASLLEIPVFKKLTGMVIDLLVDQAIGVILG